MQPKVATARAESADHYDRFDAIKDKQSLLVRKARRSQTLVWDPWPVTKVQKDAIFDAAMKLVRQRSSQCVDICANKIELLPASGTILGVQGGSRELPLYSLRSPDTLPVRFHLWNVAGLKTWRNEQDGCWTKEPGNIAFCSQPFHVTGQQDFYQCPELILITVYHLQVTLCSGDVTAETVMVRYQGNGSSRPKV